MIDRTDLYRLHSLALGHIRSSKKPSTLNAYYDISIFLCFRP